VWDAVGAAIGPSPLSGGVLWAGSFLNTTIATLSVDGNGANWRYGQYLEHIGDQSAEIEEEPVMDDLDQRLIAELRVNARASVPTLAAILGVARGTVQARLNKLVASGVIAGFTVKLRESRPDAMVRGVMMIELAGRNIKPAVASLRRNPGFVAVHTTNGIWDLIAEIEVPGLAEFNSVVTAVRSMDGVAKSETHLFLGPA
jgi:DNA-binding Lrp family transcriptional regulator